MEVGISEKKCSECGEVKPLTDYPKKKNSKDGTRNKCKICYSEYRRKYYGRYKDRVRKWYLDNKELTIQRSKQWKENNKDRSMYLNRISDKRRRTKINEYRKSRYNDDFLFCTSERIRTLIIKSFKKKDINKNHKVESILGCTFNQFKQYIESQFETGMNWKNKGEWELDHIIPISSAINEEEIYLLNHYTNFQPMWKEDNLRKSNKYKEEDKQRYLKELKKNFQPFT